MHIDSTPASARSLLAGSSSHPSEAGALTAAKCGVDTLRRFVSSQVLDSHGQPQDAILQSDPVVSRHPSEIGNFDVAKKCVEALNSSVLESGANSARSTLMSAQSSMHRPSETGGMTIAKGSIEHLKQFAEGGSSSSTLKNSPSLAEANAWTRAAVQAIDSMQLQNSARSTRSASSVRSQASASALAGEAMNALERIRSREQALGRSRENDHILLATPGPPLGSGRSRDSRTDSCASLSEAPQIPSVAATRAAEDTVSRIRMSLFGQPG
jgi:hypothetical protein